MLIYDSWLRARAGREGTSLWEAGRCLPLNWFLHTKVLSLPTFVSFFLMIVRGGPDEPDRNGPRSTAGAAQQNLIKKRQEDRSCTKTSAGNWIFIAITQNSLMINCRTGVINRWLTLWEIEHWQQEAQTQGSTPDRNEINRGFYHSEIQ